MSGKVVDLRRRGFQPNLGRGVRVRRTEYRRALTATKLAAGRVHLRLVDELDAERPRTRADCINGPRPCPWVGCRHNAFLDVTSSGSITFNQGDAEPDEVPAERSCTLDIADRGADRGGSTLEDVSEVFRFTRQAAFHLEAKALASLKRRGRVLGEFSDAPAGAAPRKFDVDRMPTRELDAVGGDEGENEEDAPPTRLSFFAHADVDADGLEAVERADDAACRAVWTMFVKDSNARGFAVRSPKARDTTKSPWRQAKAVTPNDTREEQPMNGTTTNGAATSLSPRLRATLDAWRELTKNGETPTSAELAEKAKLSSPANAQNALSVLRKQGLVPQGDRRAAKAPAKRPKSKPAAAARPPKTKRGFEDYPPPTVPPAKPPRASSSDPVIAAMIARRDEFRRKADALDVAIEAMAVAL